MNARRAELSVTYNGVNIDEPIAKSLTQFAYTDYIGQLDDLQLSLEDKQQRWQGDWMPTEGDSLACSIYTVHWNKDGERKQLDIGEFEVDSFSFSGPPDTVTIQATSLPAGSNVRREKRSRAWETVKLRTVAQDVADRAGLRLMYELEINPTYERLEQTEQSDLSFLFSLAQKEGAALKVAGGYLVLFDEFTYESKPAIATITRSDQASYSFDWSTVDAAYRACQLTYTSTVKKETITATYTPPRAPSRGPVLKVNDPVDSAEEALRVAKKRLREQNKNYGRGNLSFPGDLRLVAGVTINIEGWHKFDGKYFVESARHAIDNNGYTTSISIRKVLGW